MMKKKDTLKLLNDIVECFHVQVGYNRFLSDFMLDPPLKKEVHAYVDSCNQISIKLKEMDGLDSKQIFCLVKARVVDALAETIELLKDAQQKLEAYDGLG